MKTTEEKNTSHKGKHITLTADFLMGTLKARRVWINKFQVLKKYDRRLIKPVKLSAKAERGKKVFHYIKNLKIYIRQTKSRRKKKPTGNNIMG